ncbi:MAG: hypothetical protein JXQ91_02340 [Vannielia sp.]|uniref:hypothetical protein n=1 Tax=Vannielia sp. TaxID=2813045 RepID=UPI003B8E333C
MTAFARIAAIITLSLALPQQAAAQVRLETAGKVAVRAVKALGPQQEAALARFGHSHDYYGAFYVSRSGDVAHGHAGASSAAAAHLIARLGCERRARQACVPHAEIMPQGVNAGPKGRIANSGTLANVMVDRFRSLRQGRWSAFATTPEGAWGGASNLGSGAEAKAVALQQCRGAAVRARQSYPVAMAREMAQRGLFSCRMTLVLEK